MGHGGLASRGAGHGPRPRRGRSVFLATSNPGRVYALEGAAGSKGTFVSKVKDTETVSSWGRLRWEARAPRAPRCGCRRGAGTPGAPTPHGPTGRRLTPARTASPSPASGRASSR